MDLGSEGARRRKRRGGGSDSGRSSRFDLISPEERFGSRREGGRKQREPRSEEEPRKRTQLRKLLVLPPFIT